MLDAQKIENMSGEEKLQHFEAFTALAFPGYSVGAIAEKIGYGRRQVQEWKTNPDRIRPIVLLLLQEWAFRGDQDNPEREIIRRTMADINDSLQAVAQNLQDIAQDMRKLGEILREQ